MRIQKSCGIAWGTLCLCVILCACAASPEDAYLDARRQFHELASLPANEFLQTELTQIQTKLDEIKTQLHGRAGPSLESQIDTVLDQLAAARRRYDAVLEAQKQEQLLFLAYIHFNLDSAVHAIEMMPARTYVDQNRRDTARLRLQEFRRLVDQYQTLVLKKEYHRARAEQNKLRTQLEHVLRQANIHPVSWDVIRASLQTQRKSPSSQTHALAKVQ